MDYLNLGAYILVALFKLAGTLVLGLGMGWLALDIFKKGGHAWQFQIAFFLGIIGLLVAFLRFAHIGLGGFGLGMGIALLMWGLPKKKKNGD